MRYVTTSERIGCLATLAADSNIALRHISVSSVKPVMTLSMELRTTSYRSISASDTPSKLI